MKKCFTVHATVTCVECGKHHDLNGETYLAVYGNITKGQCGGIVGNNLDDEGRVVKATVVCDENCLHRLVCQSLGKKLRSAKSTDELDDDLVPSVCCPVAD